VEFLVSQSATIVDIRLVCSSTILGNAVPQEGILLTTVNGQQTLVVNNPTLISEYSPASLLALSGTDIPTGFAEMIGHGQAINDQMWAKVAE
jgi:hypothetical protein